MGMKLHVIFVLNPACFGHALSPMWLLCLRTRTQIFIFFMRVKRGFVARRRRKKILSQSRSFFASSNNLFRIAKQFYLKRWRYAYKSRRIYKRALRRIWLCRINAFCRLYDFSYAQWMKKQNNAWHSGLNRKTCHVLMLYDVSTSCLMINMALLSNQKNSMLNHANVTRLNF